MQYFSYFNISFTYLNILIDWRGRENNNFNYKKKLQNQELNGRIDGRIFD